uniref:uncharacterized protein n=1 Tax=Myxine glutinosa TaxID=7769 RepID=UPI00358FBCB9
MVLVRYSCAGYVLRTALSARTPPPLVSQIYIPSLSGVKIPNLWTRERIRNESLFHGSKRFVRQSVLVGAARGRSRALRPTAGVRQVREGRQRQRAVGPGGGGEGGGKREGTESALRDRLIWSTVRRTKRTWTECTRTNGRLSASVCTYPVSATCPDLRTNPAPISEFSVCRLRLSPPRQLQPRSASRGNPGGARPFRAPLAVFVGAHGVRSPCSWSSLCALDFVPSGRHLLLSLAGPGCPSTGLSALVRPSFATTLPPALDMKPYMPFSFDPSPISMLSGFSNMDPVQKAVLNHTFGVAPPPRKKSLIMCTVCQIRFNSEVCFFTEIKPSLYQICYCHPKSIPCPSLPLLLHIFISQSWSSFFPRDQ